MSEANYQPGQWVEIEVGQGGPWDSPMSIFEIHSANSPEVIAEFVDEKHAKLIAAAPDLLAAAEAVKVSAVRVSTLPGEEFVVNGDAMRELFAAIAKATGGK